MTDTPSQTQTSTFAAANETVREVARDVREGLGDGKPPGSGRPSSAT